MTAISAPDATILRYQYRRVTNLKLNIVPLRTIGTADIAAFTATYPRATYDVDNTSTFGASKRDYFFRIYNGSTIRYEGAMRANPLDNGDGTGVLYMAGHVDGDTGTAQLEAYTIAENDSVVEYDVIVPKSFLSRIDAGTLYKRWDVEYTDQNENPRPVCNFGIDRQHSIADGGTQTGIVFDASDSFSWNGNSLTYLWTLPAGVTITTGTTTTSSITVSATHGVHNIECRVTDSVTGSSKRGHRWLFVNDVSNTPAFSDLYPVDGLNIRHDTNGLNVTFTAQGDISDTYLYTGAHVLITWDYEFSTNGQTWVQPSEQALYRKTCKSYVQSFNVSQDADGIKRYDFTCVDAVTMAGALPIAPQAMIRNDTPTNWTEVHSRLMSAAGLAYQITEFHCSSVFLIGDFDPSDFDDVTKENFKVNQGSVGDALKRAARYVPGGAFMPALDGRYLMRRSLNYEPLAWRVALPVRFTWQDTDILDSISYNLNEVMRAGFTEGGAFVDGTTTTAYFYRRGLGAQMQGVSTERLEDFVADDEDAGAWYVGQHHALINANVQSITFTPLHDVFDIAERYKYTLGISAYDPMTRQVLASDGMISAIRYAFPSANDVSMECDFVPETIGKDAQTVPQSPVSTTVYKLPKVKTYTWDFTASDGGWSANVGGTSWVTSEGWRINTVTNLFGIQKTTTSSTTRVITMTVTVGFATTGTIGTSSTTNSLRLFDAGAGTPNAIVTGAQLETRYNSNTVPFSELAFVMTVSDTAGGQNAEDLLANFSSSQTLYVRSVSITYTGTNNFTGGA